MTRKVVAAYLLGAISAISFHGVAQGDQISDGEVRIGVLTDLSGSYSDLSGAGSVVAAQVAIDDFKATAKASFRSKRLSADYQSKRDSASAKARAWFDPGAGGWSTG